MEGGAAPGKVCLVSRPVRQVELNVSMLTIGLLLAAWLANAVPRDARCLWSVRCQALPVLRALLRPATPPHDHGVRATPRRAFCPVNRDGA